MPFTSRHAHSEYLRTVKRILDELEGERNEITLKRLREYRDAIKKNYFIEG